jgi:hypothetical protein
MEGTLKHGCRTGPWPCRDAAVFEPSALGPSRTVSSSWVLPWGHGIRR